MEGFRQAGDIVSFENGGPDFVRDVSGGLDQARAEHEALQIKKHFRALSGTGFGLVDLGDLSLEWSYGRFVFGPYSA